MYYAVRYMASKTIYLNMDMKNMPESYTVPTALSDTMFAIHQRISFGEELIRY
jgi:hypothetical protein